MAATDERAIHEFPTGTIDENSLLIMDRPTSTPGEYETEKFAIANLGLKLLGGIDFPSNLDTDEQDIFGAINEVNAKAMNIAAEYDETASYSKGDYCIYQNAAYRCIKASGTTTGTFVAADWTQIKVLAEVKANTENIDLKQNSNDNSLATVAKTVAGAINENKSVIGYSYDEYDSTSAYSTGDLCLYNNVLYKAKQATTGNLPTNTTYWESMSIADEIGRIDTALSGKADYSVISGLTIQTQYIDSTESLFVAYSIGKLVFIKAKLKATNNIGNNYGLIYGLPIPHDVMFSLMPVFKDGRDFNNPTNVKNISAVVSNTGVLTLQTYPDSITSGEWLYINSMYIAN